MSNEQRPDKPTKNSEKFKPQNVQDDGKAGQAINKTKPDTPQGSEHHLQRKSMHRR